MVEDPIGSHQPCLRTIGGVLILDKILEQGEASRFTKVTLVPSQTSALSQDGVTGTKCILLPETTTTTTQTIYIKQWFLRHWTSGSEGQWPLRNEKWGIPLPPAVRTSIPELNKRDRNLTVVFPTLWSGGYCSGPVCMWGDPMKQCQWRWREMGGFYIPPLTLWYPTHPLAILPILMFHLAPDFGIMEIIPLALLPTSPLPSCRLIPCLISRKWWWWEKQEKETESTNQYMN